MTAPKRIQLRRTKGWRMPENTVKVARPTKWGNPFKVGHTQTRCPRVGDTSTADWEYEGRLDKTSGTRQAYVHNDNTVTWHDIEDATAEQCVILYAEYIGAVPVHHLDYQPNRKDQEEFVAMVRAELRGKNLACFCPLTDAQGNHVPCHADVLLELANGGAER